MAVIQTTIRMDARLKRKLRRAARQAGMTESDIVQAALREYLGRLCTHCGRLQPDEQQHTPVAGA